MRQLTQAQTAILLKFDLSSKPIPKHGQGGYHSLVHKGLLEYSTIDRTQLCARLTPDGLILRKQLSNCFSDEIVF